MSTSKASKRTPARPALSGSSELAPKADIFPIVGVGASAGGLEAFEAFFHHVPADCGMAFVLVPHLDPDHVSILTEILQRATAMPVVEAADQMPVRPGQVHIIPPNRDMAIFHGLLQLSVPDVPRGQRLPIDAFLRSLAEDQGERAMGIILSGTGSDGTLGLGAILDAGGLTLVQEPATANYDGMPSSALRAGHASHVLPVEDMYPAMLAGVRHAPLAVRRAEETLFSAGSMNRVLMILRTATGHDFSLYKKSTITRRIERRMIQHDLKDLDVYARYLKENPAEVQTLFKELLINVTSFFRDPEAFAVLRQDILPALFADKPEDYVFRVWVAGCASGEEAYSIAMLLREFMDETRQELKVQIYATDLDEDAIAQARAGAYPAAGLAELSPERLRRFFVQDGGNFRVRKDIREMVVFAVQNVIKDPPFTRLDLLSCRNLMIYLEPELQNRLIPVFHYALKPDGVLFLSPSESIGSHTELFVAASRKWKFYRSIHSANAIRSVLSGGLSWNAGSSPAPEKIMQKPPETNFANLTREALIDSYAPASVVINGAGNILYVHGETGKYLRPAPGQASLNLMDMAREGLQLDLRNALLAASQGTATLGREATVKTESDVLTVSLSVRPLVDPAGAQDLCLVSFVDLPQVPVVKRRRGSAASKGSAQVEELERDLVYTRKNLQATIEEQQRFNEEVKSANEELQSTNEELQSTNEELETSKEELQSVNEELITVNAELQAKIEQLAGMQNDMKNLLDNVSIGTIFLDRHLAIRRFTREASQVYRLVPTDVGRPLADIKSDLADDELIELAHGVLESLIPREREVRVVGGARYLARIQPYRTLDNVIEGVVLTFTDISRLLVAEASERKARQLAESIVDTVREPLVVLDSRMQVVTASRSFYQRFLSAPGETLGRSLFELGQKQWDIPVLRDLLDRILLQDQVFDSLPVDCCFPDVGPLRLLLNGRRVVAGEGEPPLILLAMEEAARSAS